jgi:hypothetical protein
MSNEIKTEVWICYSCGKEYGFIRDVVVPTTACSCGSTIFIPHTLQPSKIMNKEIMEMESEKYLESYAHPDNQFGDQDGLIMNKKQIEDYGDLRAKEAIKDFAEELITRCESQDDPLNPYYIKHLAKQKGIVGI